MSFDDYDLTVTQILNIVGIKTDSTWFLENLTTSDYWILCLVVNGQSQYSWNNQIYQLNKDDMVFFQEGFTRSARSTPENPWQFIVLKFRLLTNNESTLKALHDIPNIIHSSPIHIRQNFSMMEQLWRGRYPGYMLRCKSLLYDTIYSIMRQSSMFYDKNLPHQDKLGCVLDLITHNVGENYSVDELAIEADLSPSYFRMLFKRFTGYSALQYQNYVKIRRAQDLLNAGGLRVTEVANMVGIQDIYYFSRLFKQITGIPPSDVHNK